LPSDLAVREKQETGDDVLWDAARGMLTAMSTFWQRHIVGTKPVDPRILRASSPNSSEFRSPLFGRSRFTLSSKACVFLGIVGAFAGTSSGSSSALAEAEDNVGQQINDPGYSVTNLANGTLTNLLINSYADEEVARYLSTLDHPHNAEESALSDIATYTGSHPAFHSSTNPHGFDDSLIPEAVWSLDGSIGVHVDHIPGGPGSDIYAVFNSRAGINDFWMRAIASSWIYNNTNKASGLFFVPVKFQLASCGGTSAERGNLDYCDSVKLLDNQLNDSPVATAPSNDNTTTPSATNSALPSNNPPASNSAAQSIPALLAPTSFDQSWPHETLNVIGPCDVFASCSSVVTDPLGTLLDAPAPDPLQLVAELTPPIAAPAPDPPLSIVLPPSEPPISGPTGGGGDPTLAPIFSPPPESVTTPEASTWVMTVVGFGFMAFTFRKRRRPRNNPISVIDLSEET
jgi:hypothetical protein